MLAAIYCRVSTNEEVQQNALKIQKEEARKAAAENGWELTDEYVESESGTTAEGRLEYLRMLSDMSEKKFDVLVIKSEDRLNRNVKDWYLLIDRLTQAEIKLYFYLTKTFYQPDNSLITGLKAMLAEEYSRQLSIKENNAHRYRQEHGCSVIITGNTYGLRKNQNKEVVIIEHEAEIVRMMYELAKDGYGSRSISSYLYNLGITNRAGRQFDDADIRRMIRNPLFMGTAVMNKTHYDFDKKKQIKNPKSEWIYHKNIVPAIVDSQLWKEANEMLDIRAERNGITSAHKKHAGGYNFSGKIRCGCCQNVYYKTFRKKHANEKEVIVEWKCSAYLKYGRDHKDSHGQLRKVTKKFGKGCDNWHVREAVLSGIMDDLSLKLFDASQDDHLLDQILRVLRQTLSRQDKQESADGLEYMLECLEQRKSALLDKLLDGIVSDEQYSRKLEELCSRQAKLEQQYQCLRQEQETLQQGASRTEQIKERLQKGGMDEIRRRRLMDMIEEIVVQEDELLILVQSGRFAYSTKEDQSRCQKFYYSRLEYFANASERLDQRRQELYELMKEHPQWTNQQAADKLGVGFSTVRRWIKKYQEEGTMKFDADAKKWIVK